MDYAIFVSYHSLDDNYSYYPFLVCLTFLIVKTRQEESHFQRMNFFLLFFSPLLPIALLCPPPFSSQKHFGQLISHPDNSSIAPTVKSELCSLTHSRCTVRKVLSPFLLNRQNSRQGHRTRSSPLLEVNNSGLKHLTFRSPSRLFLPSREGTFARQHLSGAFDEPYMSFPSSKMFKEHQ